MFVYYKMKGKSVWKFGEYVWFLSNFTDQCIKLYQQCMEQSWRNTPKTLLEILY